jgi:hypothetical protein
MSVFGSLDPEDQHVIITGIVGAAGPIGIAEDEAERQVDIVSEWVFDTVLRTGLLDLMRAGAIRATVKADGEIVWTKNQ